MEMIIYALPHVSPILIYACFGAATVEWSRYNIWDDGDNEEEEESMFYFFLWPIIWLGIGIFLIIFITHLYLGSQDENNN